MTDYPLRDAARYIGVPVDVLLAMNWAHTGPRAIARSYWSPVFAKAELDRYLAEHPTKPLDQTPIVAPGRLAVKRMRQK